METLIQGFIDATWPGRTIAIGLTIGSIFSWAIIFFKAKLYRKSENEIRGFQTMFDNLGGNLDAIYQQIPQKKAGPAGRLLQACYHEIHRLAPMPSLEENDHAGKTSRERRPGIVIRSEVVAGVERASDRSIAETEITFEKGLTFLALVSSISPLMGLLGTVWGILEVFQAMDQSAAPSIKDIAPGISAALVTTAFGLLAAVPAATAYSVFLVRTNRMIATLENLAGMISNILVRHQLRQTR